MENKKNMLNRRNFILTSSAVGGYFFNPFNLFAGSNKTISWWNQFDSPTTKEVFPIVVKQFEDNHPGIKVEFELTGGPPGGGDYIEVLLARIASGNPPDTITLWSPPSQFGSRGALEPLDGMMEKAKIAKKNAFYEGVLSSCVWKGKIYGLPASAGAGSIFINKDIFSKRGISTKRDDFPKTWDEIKRLSAEITQWKGDELIVAGYVPWANSWLKPLWSGLNGGKLFDPSTNKYVINSEQNIEWLDFWLQWLNEQYKGDVDLLNTFAGGKWESVYPESAFNLNKQSMAAAGSWACTDRAWNVGWEVAKFPVGPSGSKSMTAYWPNWFSIPKGCKNIEEAFLFIEHFTTKGWITWYKAVMDTPAWKGFPSDVVTEKLVAQEGKARAMDIHHFYANYLEDAVEMWNSPIEDFASDTINSAIDEVLHKVKSPKDALKEAQKRCQSKLEKTLAG